MASKDAEKARDKIQHSVLIKHPKQTTNKEELPQLDEKWPQKTYRNKVRISPFLSVSSHHTASPG